MSTTARKVEREFKPVRNSTEFYVSLPPDGVKSSPDEPTLIILFGWMDAALPHIYKYTESYHKLYPGATQVIARSSNRAWLKTQTARDAEIAPAAKALRELGLFDPEEDRILVHAFSNGGCFELITLSNLLRHDQSVAAIPARAIVFDSCPGDSSISSGVTAFTAGIRNPVLKYLASGIVLALLGITVGVVTLTGMEDPFVAMHNRLLSQTTLPQNIPKTFICSKGDAVISYKATLEFAEQCRQGGADVEVNLYEDTPHVNHLKSDPEKYWRIVTGTWNRAMKRP